MKRILLVINFAASFLNGYSQKTDMPCDKAIEWDIDDNAIKKELPYNQTICFRLKSKKISFDNIDDILILEHKGKKNSNKSLEYYANHKDLISRKFRVLKFGNYDKDNKTIDVQMVEMESGDSKMPAQSYVLQPSKQYSIFLLTSKPNAETNKLLNLIKTYLDSTSSTSSTSGQLFDEIKNRYTEMLKAGPLLRSKFFAEETPNLLILKYLNSIYKFDLLIDSAIRVYGHFIDSLMIKGNYFLDSSTSLFQKALSVIILKGGCVFQFPCSIDKCTLYKFFVSIQESDEKKWESIVEGQATLLDLANPLFAKKNDLPYLVRLSNIDTTILQLHNLRLYIHNLFINDCKVYDCCDSIKKHYNKRLVSERIEDYIMRIDKILLTLNLSKKTLSFLEKQSAMKLIKIKEERLTFYISKNVTGNTLTYGLEPRNKLNIIPVLGYAYYGFQKSFNSFTPYTGIVISLSPLNDDVEFRFLRRKTLAQRLTFMTGVTLSSLKEDNKRDNLFSNGSNLMIGFGFKLNHIVTFNIGGIIFKKENPNPFIATKRVAVTPFTSISLNLKLKTLFEGLLGLIPTK